MLGKLFILILILSNIGCDQLGKMLGGKKAKTTAQHIEPGPVMGAFNGDQSFVTYKWENIPGNGWFPNVSPDGNYVGGGQGAIMVADLNARTTIPIQSGNCYAGRWIRPGVLTYINTITNDTAYRMEAIAGSWTPNRTNDDPALVAGNQFQASDGHWASWLGSRGVAYDGIDFGYGYGVSQNETWVGFAPNNNNTELLMFNNGQFVRSIYPQSPMGEFNVLDGRAVYGGHGPTWGWSPEGGDVNLSILNYEGSVQILRVGDALWVASSAWDFQANIGYVFIRPWGDRAAIVVRGVIAGSHVVFTGSEFAIATFEANNGTMSAYKVPVNAPRYTF
jgi:hypothetical protein